MKKCTDQLCHADNPDDAKYCHMCGKKITNRSLWLWMVCIVMASLSLFAIVAITNIWSADCDPIIVEEPTDAMPMDNSDDGSPVLYNEDVVDEEPAVVYDVYDETSDEYIEDEDSEDPTEGEQPNRMVEADIITRTYHSISSEYRYPQGTLTQTQSVSCTDEEWKEMKKNFFESRGYRRVTDDNETYHIYTEIYENGNDLNVIYNIRIEN